MFVISLLGTGQLPHGNSNTHTHTHTIVNGGLTSPANGPGVNLGGPKSVVNVDLVTRAQLLDGLGNLLALVHADELVDGYADFLRQ